MAIFHKQRTPKFGALGICKMKFSIFLGPILSKFHEVNCNRQDYFVFHKFNVCIADEI